MQKTLEKELGVAMKAMIKTLLNDSLKHLAQQGNYNGTLLKVRCVKGQLRGANNVKKFFQIKLEEWHLSRCLL